MDMTKRIVLLITFALLFACAKEPFGDVADVVLQDARHNSGAIKIAINDDMRDLARKNGYTIYGKISVHSLDSKKTDCIDATTKRSPQWAMTRDEKDLYETGWAPIHDMTVVTYQRQGDVISVSIADSAKETRCKLPDLNGQLKVHVHFLGDPMPFGSSDEGMFGLDIIVPLSKLKDAPTRAAGSRTTPTTR